MCCAEAEVDALTGECCLRRVDVAMDQGCPLNPLSDLGQVEGALMMSIGYFLTEQVRTSPRISYLPWHALTFCCPPHLD